MTITDSHNNAHMKWRDGRVAEGGGLLNRYTGHIVSRVRIPLSPPVGTRVRFFKNIKRETQGIIKVSTSQLEVLKRNAPRELDQ